MATKDFRQERRPGKEGLFSVIFGDSDDDDGAHRRRARKSSGVIRSPSSKRGGRRKSKYYQRPIFKEPGSKPPIPQQDIAETPVKEKKALPSSAIVNQLRGEVGKLWIAEEDPETIQPKARASGLLEKYVGTAKERSKTSLDGDEAKLNAAGARNVKLEDAHDLQKTPSELSQLRHEVNRMVTNFFVPKPSEQPSHSTVESRKSRNRLSNRDSSSSGYHDWSYRGAADYRDVGFRQSSQREVRDMGYRHGAYREGPAETSRFHVRRSNESHVFGRKPTSWNAKVGSTHRGLAERRPIDRRYVDGRDDY